MANINRYDDLNTGAIAYATLVSCIALVVIILSIRALCCAWVEGEEERKSINAHYVTSDQKISEQKSRLAGYTKETVEVVTPAQDGGEATTAMEERIHIPINRAKAILLKEWAASSNSANEPSA